MNLRQLVYLDRDTTTFGRLPTCNVVLESSRVPQMISRTHGFIRRVQSEGKPDEWVISDNRSLNGILVNGDSVGSDGEGKSLQSGDLIVFGRKIVPPEFEFVFQAPTTELPPQPVESAEHVTEHMQRLAELEAQLQAERNKMKEEIQRRRLQSRNTLTVSELHSELACSICQDWLVHAATVDCSHTFCTSCIETWLLHKNFHCPVCRQAVTREPVRTRAVDTIVRKTVDRLPEEQRQEFQQRLAAAQVAIARRKQLHAELEKSVNDALKKGKAFFHISSNWNKREKETFQKGIKDYIGDTREVYCRLTGLTVQWVHSVDDSKLNQALHNLGLQQFVSATDTEIRRRLLNYIRYG